MLFTEEFLAQLCPTYKKEFDAVMEALNKTEVSKMKQDLLEDFSNKFLMPNECWNLLFRVIPESMRGMGGHHAKWNNDLIKNKIALEQKAFYHFTKYGSIDKNKCSVHKLVSFPYATPEKSTRMGHIYKCVTYPHRELKRFFFAYEKAATSLPQAEVRKNYTKFLKLYDEIMAAENNVEKWFKLLLEVGDDEFVIHNVEYRIGTNLLDKTLWKLYMNFLKDKNLFKEMLHTYSKYCRFFLDDKEMLEKYKNETEKYGPINLEWPNLSDFEKKKDEKFVDGKQNESQTLSRKRIHSGKEPQQVSKTVSKNVFEAFKTQKFTLPKPIISYILEKTNHIVLRKLFSSCKFFFVKKQTPICYRFDFFNEKFFVVNHVPQLEKAMRNNFKTFEETIYFDSKFQNSELVKNFYLTTCFKFKSPNSQLFHGIIQKLHRCDAKYISIFNQHLFYDEFKFLVGHGNVRKLNLKLLKIEHSNNEAPVFLEDIMGLLPNIKELKLQPVKINSKTAEIIANQTFFEKIWEIRLLNITGEAFDPMELYNFLMKNAEKNCEFIMSFIGKNYSNKYKTDLNSIIKNCIILSTLSAILFHE